MTLPSELAMNIRIVKALADTRPVGVARHFITSAILKRLKKPNVMTGAMFWQFLATYYRIPEELDTTHITEYTDFVLDISADTNDIKSEDACKEEIEKEKNEREEEGVKTNVSPIEKREERREEMKEEMKEEKRERKKENKKAAEEESTSAGRRRRKITSKEC